MSRPEDIFLGKRLSSVVFVMDYVQLVFDELTLTCYVWPVVERDKLYKFGEQAYENQLRALIQDEVSEYKIKEKDRLQLKFVSGSELSLNLDPDNPEIISEVAHVMSKDDDWWVYE